MVENVLYWPSQGCCVTLVSKAEWNVALCLCYHGFLKPSLWNHLGSSCLLLHQNFVCEILSYSGISLWLGQRKTQTKQAKLILFFFFFKGTNMIQRDAKPDRWFEQLGMRPLRPDKHVLIDNNPKHSTLRDKQSKKQLSRENLSATLFI